MSQPASDIPAHRFTPDVAQRIEAFWQQHWADAKVFTAPNPGEPGFDPSKPKFYLLDFFPYPSGAGLHVGHPLGYIATDVLGRYRRMCGDNVLHAMGFDAFGLPAEQYAIETGTHPRITTYANIDRFRAQLRRLGLAHEARRAVATTDPDFYKWTQWIFLKIYDSWYDDRAATQTPTASPQPAGRARPIAELVTEFESGRIATRSGRAWASLSADEKRDEIDSRRLAYLAEVPVNWCPRLGTVLANEEVTADGRSERGDHPVFRRPMKQWMLRITAYADRLIDDLQLLDWPEPVKLMQRNWIGRSEGAEVVFSAGSDQIQVFTTRPDTIFGATYMVLSPEHPLVDKLTADAWPSGTKETWKGRWAGATAADRATPRAAIAAYRAMIASRSDQQRQESKEKTGVFIGAFATNPATGQPIPIFIADYVLMGYGTGAIMAVPGHDERDGEFAREFDLPAPIVVRPTNPADSPDCFTGDGVSVNSSNAEVSLDGLPTPDAKRRITQWLEAKGLGHGTVTFKLRDWLFSRQRYWGEPFPIVFDERGHHHALPESMLPVELPDLENFSPEASDDPDAPPVPPLGRATQWTAVTLDLGDGPRRYTRELNTMPNWAGSCWYYLRYLDPDNSGVFCDAQVERYWMAGVGGPVGGGPLAPRAVSSDPQSASGAPLPGEHATRDPSRSDGATRDPSRSDGSTPRAGGVDLYVGGVEHAVLHLLYARFWHKVLFDLGYVSTAEPFQRLFNQGYIQAFAYRDARGVYVDAFDVQDESGANVGMSPEAPGPFFHHGQPVTREYGKMGKSLKNAITPDEICAEYGCDTLRLYEMSMGPLEQSKPWNPRDIIGSQRFLQRVWRNMIDEHTGRPTVIDAAPDAATLKAMHKTIKAVRRGMESLAFNTVVARLIEFNNHLSTLSGVPRDVARVFILMLAPLAPHMAEELWSRLGFSRGSLAFEPFPVHDESQAADAEIELPVQINGKLRGKIVVPASADTTAIEAVALANADVQKFLGDKPVRKIIVVKGKMVSLVV